MKSSALIFLILFIFIPLSSPARSEKTNSNSEEILEIEEVVVTATRTEESVLDVPQHVTVITEEEIRKSGSKNLAEVLSVYSGVSISDYGPAGAIQSLSVRGSTSSQVLVLIDGVRIVGSHGGADLSLIPLDNIERIEIVRGGTSALYGADAVGGVINIITKRKADKNIRIFIENGSYLPKKHVKGFSFNKDEYDPYYLDLLDTQKATIQYSKDIKGIQLITSGTFNRAENGYIFKDTNSEDRKRENADFIGWNLSAGIHLPLEHGGVDLTGSYLNNKRGIPGTESNPLLEASQSDQNIQSALRYYTDNFFTDRLTIDVNTHFNFSKLIYKDPQSSDSEHKTYSTGLEIVQEMLAFDIFSLVYGGNVGLDVVDSTDLGDIDRIHGGGFIGSSLYLTSRFTLQPVLRYDYYSDFKGDINFKLGGVYIISDTASLKGSISKSYRAPTFNDLYWPEDAFTEGNPDLKPETGYSLDFGLSSIRNDIQYDIFGFVRYVKDVILWQPGGDGKWRPTNLGKALYPGIETYLNVSFLNYFSANLGYTFIYTYALTGNFTGVLALPVIAMVSLAIGGISIIQSLTYLPKFGGEALIGKLLVTIIVRELSPILTGFIVIGRSGTAITAEIGNMVVSHEIQALEAMGVDPIQYLVIPRIMGVTISLICLNIYFNILSIIGGFLVSKMVLVTSFSIFMQKIVESMTLADITVNIVKGFVFGILISLICTFEGFSVKLSSTEVPRVTTNAVVNAITAVFLADGIITVIYYI